MACTTLRSKSVLFLLACTIVNAVVPTGEIDFTTSTGKSSSIYCAPAGFGGSLPANSDRLKLALKTPKGLQDGCDPDLSSKANGPFVLLVQRSPNCSFIDRTKAAQKIGASAVIVGNTVEGIYHGEDHAEKKDDYECSNGQSWESSLKEKMNGFSTSSCAHSCESGRCLLTGKTKDDLRKVCCAWDIYMTMSMSDESSDDVDIPTVFITMEDYDNLAPTSSSSQIHVEMYERWRPSFNVSSLILWALAVITVFTGGVLSARDVRKHKHSIERAQEIGKSHHKSPESSENQQQQQGQQFTPNADRLQLSMSHAVSFIGVASISLIVLFYFDLSELITVAFCIASASSVSTILLIPFLSMLPIPQLKRVIVDLPKVGPVLGYELLAIVVSITLAVVWLLNRTETFAKILQDIFGVCLCLLFLSTIQIPSLKVAALLLSLAFLYDIFFVFVSPLFFSESVMVKVASGKQASASADYCEKYPDDSDCQSYELPMLLLFPRLMDYMSGDVMLGLGDIVLPGLLTTYVARFDAATLPASPLHPTAFMSRASPLPWNFIVIVVGYAVGLLLASSAVYLMQMGQPALLYIVPCTLGLIVLRSRSNHTFHSLWTGAPLEALEQGVLPTDTEKANEQAPLLGEKV